MATVGSALFTQSGPDPSHAVALFAETHGHADAPSDKLTLRAGWESRRGYDRSADVIPVRDAVYRRRGRIAGALAYEAEIDGIALYERA